MHRSSRLVGLRWTRAPRETLDWERKCYLCARVVGEKALLAGSSQAASPHCTGGTRHLPPRRPRSNCSGSSGSLQVQSREPAGAVLARGPPTIWTPRRPPRPQLRFLLSRSSSYSYCCWLLPFIDLDESTNVESSI